MQIIYIALFLSGDQPCMLDMLFWPHMFRIYSLKLYSAAITLLPERFPNILAWIELMKKQPAVKAVDISPEVHIQFFQSHLSGSPNYDIGL
jgi:glutathione S-transferase